MYKHLSFEEEDAIREEYLGLSYTELRLEKKRLSRQSEPDEFRLQILDELIDEVLNDNMHDNFDE